MNDCFTSKPIVKMGMIVIAHKLWCARLIGRHLRRVVACPLHQSHSFSPFSTHFLLMILGLFGFRLSMGDFTRFSGVENILCR